MVSLKVLDIKTFMSFLLVHPVFDSFLLSEIDLLTYNHFHIDGILNKRFFSEEELEQLDDRKYSLWGEIKPFAYELMKGKKTPLSFKIVFLLSAENVEKILAKNNTGFHSRDINGFFLNLHYENNILRLVTGTSLSTFTLDKTLDYLWDENVKSFLKHYGIICEEEV